MSLSWKAQFFSSSALALPASFPACLLARPPGLPASLPPCLPASLPPCLPACLPTSACLPPFLPACLPPSHPACLLALPASVLTIASRRHHRLTSPRRRRRSRRRRGQYLLTREAEIDPVHSFAGRGSRGNGRELPEFACSVRGLAHWAEGAPLALFAHGEGCDDIVSCGSSFGFGRGPAKRRYSEGSSG